MSSRKAFPLRLPRELYDELQRLAARELRSVNAQIEFLLREALERRGRLGTSKPDEESGGEAD
ncbi:MAG: Arc family DNA-binding protein [Planctomycetes bacterium]|nr:Arc family DNA-binding protein [Planctomycetota bacterium]